MKKNKLILIITIILVLVAAFLIINVTKGTLSKSCSSFAVEDTSLVTKVFLTDKANDKVVLEKVTPGNWTVNNKYAASNDLITIFLKTLMRIEVKSPVAKAARDNTIKRLAAISKKVEIYQTVYRIDLWGLKLFPHEKLVKTYYVGDATQDNLGTYMLMEDCEEPYIMNIPGFRGFLNSRYSPLEVDWRDHTMFGLDIPDIKSVKLEFPLSPDSSFSITNEGKTKFSLTALKSNTIIANYDTLKLLDYLSNFMEVKYEYLITNFTEHNKDSVIKTTPVHILTLTDMSGKVTTVKMFHKPAPTDQSELSDSITKFDLDRLYALFNDGKDFAMIQYYVFDNILKPLKYFIKPSAASIKKSK
jgi:phenylpyruvate tautomerase PptA (4-oxalocrotonate tautomerase family)